MRSSLRQLSRRLDEAGHRASPPTVSRLLRDRKYSLRVNSKQEAGKDHPDRGEQFQYLEAQKQAFLSAGQPVISVDTKKKELVGNFANAGQAWGQGAERVNDHDFCQEAVGQVAPYGIYDLGQNRGSVYVGESADTPRFAVDAIVAWWQEEGQATYPQATALLVLADGGGSNGCQPRAWKGQLQAQLADRLGLTVTVCHYPTGCSKGNPVERRLFGPISINWAGAPADGAARAREADTRLWAPQTGLTVRAARLPGEYPKGETLTDAEVEGLNLERHATCPRWNYTIRPRLATAP